MGKIAPPISFIEHLLAIPETPDEDAHEREAERLHIQLRPIDLLDLSSNCFVAESALNK